METVTDNEQQVAEMSVNDSGEAISPKKPRKRRESKPRAPRGRRPTFKNWISVKNSASSTLPNTRVELVINEASGVCEIRTVAPKQEGSDELEPERVQVFQFTGYSVVNEPERHAELLQKAADEANDTTDGGDHTGTDPIAGDAGDQPQDS